MPISPIISTGEAAGLLFQPDVRLIDCRYELQNPDAGREGYLKAHLAGAIFADLKHDLAAPPTPTSSRHPLPDPADFVQVLAGWGIGPEVRVVVYDAGGGGFAGRLWWMLRAVGHSQVQLLDGGLDRWQRENRPLRSGWETPPATTYRYPAQFNPDLWVSAGQVLEWIDQPGWQIVDARAPERFSGAQESIDPVAGHIRGAINRFYGLNLTPEGVFKPPEQLRQEFTDLLGGGVPDHVIVYCGSGVTACHHLIALELAGMAGARLYPGSWSEWIRDPQRPIEGPQAAAPAPVPAAPPKKAIDKQIFVDRLLETENLTDELEDSEADWLLNWGIARLDSILAGAADQESAAESVQTLMRAMRKLNRVVAAREDKDVADLAGDLAVLSDLFANAFDLDTLASEGECLAAARRLAQMPAHQAVEFLTRWGLRPISRA